MPETPPPRMTESTRWREPMMIVPVLREQPQQKLFSLGSPMSARRGEILEHKSYRVKHVTRAPLRSHAKWARISSSVRRYKGI